MIFFGEKSLRRAIDAFVRHYDLETNRQGVENRVIEPSTEIGSAIGRIECRERLGGILKYYDRDAA